MNIVTPAFLIILCGGCFFLDPLPSELEKNRSTFESLFKFAPDSAIKNITIKDHFVRDSWIFFLKMDHIPETTNRIIDTIFTREPTLRHIKRGEKLVRDDFPSKPAWFIHPPKNTKLTIGKGFHKIWSASTEVLWVDSTSKSIYYIIEGTD